MFKLHLQPKNVTNFDIYRHKCNIINQIKHSQAYKQPLSRVINSKTEEATYSVKICKRCSGVPAIK